jgi:hypothetical protein
MVAKMQINVIKGDTVANREKAYPLPLPLYLQSIRRLESGEYSL